MPAEKNCHPINACNFVYDAFGVVTATDSRGRTTTVPPGPRNRGAYYDSATGEYLMGERFYDPATGTFMTEDPARAGGNWWAYCEGDPINFSDPSGLDRVWASGDDVYWEPGDYGFFGGWTSEGSPVHIGKLRGNNFVALDGRSGARTRVRSLSDLDASA